MAESTALTIIPEGAVGAIQAGQGKVNDTLIGIQKTNTGMFGILKSMFVFDKDEARRLADQASRDKEPEGPKATVAGNMADAGKQVPGGWLALGAGLTALAAFMKSINMEDILRLPTQVGAIAGMAKFASGVAKIGTFGLGAKFIDNITDGLRLFKSNFILRVGELRTSALNKFKAIKFPSFVGLADEVKKLNFVKYIRNSKGYTLAVAALHGIGNGIKTIMAPMKNALHAVFGMAGGGPHGGGGGAISKILGPLKAAARFIGKLFLPITAILAIFDGYSGFMKEYEDTGSIVDGIRGAVEGIVDGFIGTFVRLATSAIAKGLEFLGLDQMAKFVKDFGEDITLKFKTAVGGLVDFVTGIFTLDLERITKGITALVGGTADFLFSIVTAPVNLAINFVKDLFKWGDPEKPFTIKGFLLGDDKNPGVVGTVVGWVKGLFTWGTPENPFSLKGFLLGDDKNPGLVGTVTGWVKGLFTWGAPEKPFKIKDFIFGGGEEEGVIPKIKSWFKGLFTFDVPAIKEKLLDMGKMFKAITAAAAAAVKAGWPGGESPAEAYKRVFEHMTKGGTEPADGGTDIATTTATDVKGNTTETVYKAQTINDAGSNTGNTAVVLDASNKQVNEKKNVNYQTYSGSLNTGIDSYWDNTALQARGY